MDFGDRSRFAITMELAENGGGEWLFGKFCCWINGRQVGDYDSGVSLRDALLVIKWAVWDCGKRDDCELFSLSKEAAFALIDSALYGDRDAPDTPNDMARFDVSFHVDSGGWRAFLIDCHDKSRLIYKRGAKDIDEVMLARGEFDRVIKSVQETLIAMYDRAESEDR